MESSLVVSKATSAAKVIKAGPVWYAGFIANKDGSTAGCTLTVSDSASSTVTGAAVLDHVSIASGVTTNGKQVYMNGLPGGPYLRKCAAGLRVQAVGWTGGVTVRIFYT